MPRNNTLKIEHLLKHFSEDILFGFIPYCGKRDDSHRETSVTVCIYLAKSTPLFSLTLFTIAPLRVHLESDLWIHILGSFELATSEL